jgi:hypothetical protein
VGSQGGLLRQSPTRPPRWQLHNILRTNGSPRTQTLPRRAPPPLGSQHNRLELPTTNQTSDRLAKTLRIPRMFPRHSSRGSRGTGMTITGPHCREECGEEELVEAARAHNQSSHLAARDPEGTVVREAGTLSTPEGVDTPRVNIVRSTKGRTPRGAGRVALAKGTRDTASTIESVKNEDRSATRGRRWNENALTVPGTRAPLENGMTE